MRQRDRQREGNGETDRDSRTDSSTDKNQDRQAKERGEGKLKAGRQRVFRQLEALETKSTLSASFPGMVYLQDPKGP